MNKKLRILLSLPKSLYVCLKSMNIKEAFKLPVLVAFDTKIVSLKGRINIVGEGHFGIVRIGFGGAQTALHHKCALENNGTIFFAERVNFGGGSQICTVNKHSVLSIGDHTSIMGDSHIVAKRRINIGSDCLISWDTQIMDTDLHEIYSGDIVVNSDKEINIGEHVWIGSRATILKGTTLARGTIVAACSLISGQVKEEYSVITGMPIRTLKTESVWRHTNIMD